MPGNPVKLSYTDEDSYSSPPHLGQHTKEVLKSWAGYNSSQIEDLISDNIVQTDD